MTCPKCQAEFETPGVSGSRRRPVCPACGVRLLRNVTGVVRTSAVLISTGHEDGFYGSLQEVPEHLRSQLVESTNGDNSGTIVIADRAGREQLTQVLARRENRRGKAVQKESAAGSIADERIRAADAAPARSWIPWLAVFLILVAAGLLSAWFGLRW